MRKIRYLGDKMNLLEKIITEMSPEEFEIYCLDLLKGLATDLTDYHIEHNKIYKADDGSFQLDGYIEFNVLGVNYKTFVECKKYKSPIKHSQIQVFKDTISSTGAHKGIFISTSSFQSGAMQYAKKHGIALMQIVDGYLTTLQNSTTPISICPQLLEIPKYVFAYYDLELECPINFVSREKNTALLLFLQKNQIYSV